MSYDEYDEKVDQAHQAYNQAMQERENFLNLPRKLKAQYEDKEANCDKIKNEIEKPFFERFYARLSNIPLPPNTLHQIQAQQQEIAQLIAILNKKPIWGKPKDYDLANKEMLLKLQAIYLQIQQLPLTEDTAFSLSLDTQRLQTTYPPNHGSKEINNSQNTTSRVVKALRTAEDIMRAIHKTRRIGFNREGHFTPQEAQEYKNIQQMLTQASEGQTQLYRQIQEAEFHTFENHHKTIKPYDEKIERTWKTLEQAWEIRDLARSFPTNISYDFITRDISLQALLYRLYTAIQQDYAPPEPLAKLAHPATYEEWQILIPALQILTSNPHIQGLRSPDHFYIIESPLPQAYALGKAAYISEGYLTQKTHLATVLAHLIAWVNISGLSPHTKHPPATYNMTIARQLAHPYEIDTLTSYRVVTGYRGVDTKQVGIQTNIIGTPEDIRPQPIDIIMGGGHNFAPLLFSKTQIDSEIGNERNTHKGYQAFKQYVTSLATQSTTAQYFNTITTWQAYFKQCQKKADELTAKVGQKEGLLQMLTQMKALIPAETSDRINFHYSGAERIAYLRKSLN